MTATRDIADHRSHLAALQNAALRAADPATAVRHHLRQADFIAANRVFLVGGGKAGVAMAGAAAGMLGDRLAAGIIAVPYLPARAPDRVAFIKAGHPTPTNGSLAAGREMANLLAGAGAEDLVIALISGGGSAMMELPRSGVSLEDLEIANRLLLRSGASIREVNTVRKQLSRIKGGGLARLAQPARVLGLLLSDVVGNSLEVIASGPTVPSVAGRKDAMEVIERYYLGSLLPPSVLRLLETEDDSKLETASLRIENRLIASNRAAAGAAVSAAQELGFDAELVADDWQGEAREAGYRFAELLKRASSGKCCVAGGETTVSVHGAGKGGRNQEAALAAALAIAGMPNVIVATFATDGIDGPTDAAGAKVDGSTIERARALGLNPFECLAENDSYTFFRALGDLIITGPTGTNVNDLMFGLIY